MRDTSLRRAGDADRMTLRVRAWVPGLAAVVVGVVVTGCAQPGSTAAPATSPSTAAAITATSTAAGSVSTEPAEESAGTPAPPLAACDGADLVTRNPGVLTIATAPDPTPPWFGGGGPAPGSGLESAVATSIATTLGYPADRVTWTTVDHAAAASGQATDFDLAIDRYPESEATDAVDHSTGYFSITEAIVQRSGVTRVSSSSQLATLTVGRVTGTDSTVPVGRSVDYPTDAAALAALRAGSVDAVVSSTPEAIAAAATDPSLVVVGQLPTDPMEQPEQFTVLLPHGSGLTGCVSTAVDRMRVEGTLEQLAHQWVDPLAPPLS